MKLHGFVRGEKPPFDIFETEVVNHLEYGDAEICMVYKSFIFLPATPVEPWDLGERRQVKPWNLALRVQ